MTGFLGHADRELAFFKLAAPHGLQRSEALELAAIFGGKVIDVGRAALTIALAGDPGKLYAFEAALAPFGITELARTGRITLRTKEAATSFDGMTPYEPGRRRDEGSGGGARNASRFGTADVQRRNIAAFACLGHLAEDLAFPARPRLPSTLRCRKMRKSRLKWRSDRPIASQSAVKWLGAQPCRCRPSA